MKVQGSAGLVFEPGRVVHSPLSVTIWRQTFRHGAQMLAVGPATTGRSVARGLRQKEHRVLESFAARVKALRVPARPVMLCSATSTHASQMKTFGPAMSLATCSCGF